MPLNLISQDALTLYREVDKDMKGCYRWFNKERTWDPLKMFVRPEGMYTDLSL